MMIIIRKQPNRAMDPGTGPISCLIISPSEAPLRREEINSTIKSCTAPASTTPASSHRVPGR